MSNHRKVRGGVPYGRRVIIIAYDVPDGVAYVKQHLGAAAVAILTPGNACTATHGIVANEVVTTPMAVARLSVQQRIHLAETAAPSLATSVVTSGRDRR